MKFPYDSNYQPPFPTVEIRLRNERRGLATPVIRGLVDTGADASLVPIAHLRQIRAPAVMDKRLRSHWGEWRAVQLFVVELELGERRFSNLLVVGDDQGEETVLGRTILNKLRLILDGPDNTTEWI